MSYARYIDIESKELMLKARVLTYGTRKTDKKTWQRKAKIILIAQLQKEINNY